MKIAITRLPSGFWLAGGQRMTDWAQWPVDSELKDEHFFVGASSEFKRQLRKRVKWLLRHSMS